MAIAAVPLLKNATGFVQAGTYLSGIGDDIVDGEKHDALNLKQPLFNGTPADSGFNRLEIRKNED